jgi:hypothetical protein
MEAERISSDHKVKGVDPAKIIPRQDGQDWFLMPVSGLVCLRLRGWTKRPGPNSAGRDAARAAAV